MDYVHFQVNYRAMIRSCFKDASELLSKTLSENCDKILETAETMTRALQRGNKILLFGNGGSAADAQHLAAEFVNRFLIDRPPLAAIALHTDTSILTSVGNDFSFSEVFSKQIRALGHKGDIAWAISTSGNSENVIKGLIAAREKELVTVGLTGKGGGRMKEYCDFLLAVPSRETPRIQEMHILIGHVICQVIEDFLFGQLA